MRDSFLPPLLGYVALFAILLRAQLGEFATHLPTAPNAHDAKLIVWVLAWVAHALAHAPAALFDANINYPAPAQLTGTDYFLSSQILFAPLAYLTGNPLLAVNLTALATYAFAALACERLLRALGCGAGVAFTSGLAFALGPLQTPFNIHVLQYPSFFFPLLALRLTRLREQPHARQAVLLGLVFAVGAFASLYTAVLLGVVGLVWATFELARRGPNRLRFVLLGLSAVMVAAAPLWVILRVYLTRAAHQSIGDPPSGTGPLFGLLTHPVAYGIALASLHTEFALAVVSLLALVAFGARDPLARRLVPVAITLIVLGDTLAGGVPGPLRGSIVVELFRFMRYAHRFTIVTGFGAALLLAAGLAAIARWLGAQRGRIAIGAVFLLVLLGKGTALDDGTPQEITALGRDRHVHRAVGALVHESGSGPLLELPPHGFIGSRSDGQQSLQPEAMLASTLHWLPLVDGYTGHQPAHRLLVTRLIAALPDEAALADLVDMTHVEWILLRPAAAWPEEGQRTRMEAALLSSPAVGRSWEIDGWLLLQLTREPRHPTWFATIAAGGVPGATVLGTPLTPLAAGSDVGRVRLVSAIPSTIQAKFVFYAQVEVTNAGSATWPAMPPPSLGLILDMTAGAVLARSGSVLLVERWILLDPASRPAETRREIRLRRDLPPGESLEQRSLLIAPERPGSYRLELALEQIDGARFTTPGNVIYRQDVLVTASRPQFAPPARQQQRRPASTPSATQR